VRVHDVGAPAQDRPSGPNHESEVLHEPTAAARHGNDMDAMAQLLQRVLLTADEYAQVGIIRAGIHLRHDQDVERG
jgi:hypothetical protein